jgi:adenylate/nucleoside-diphosphate kinase
MCPVSWKVYKKFVNCTHRPEYSVLYNNQFYFFAGPNERAIFCAEPQRFTGKLHFSHERNIPKRLRPHKAAEIDAQEKAISGHCPVSLKDENKVDQGNRLIVISFKDNKFLFASEAKATKFFQCPSDYANVQLPVKMPPSKNPVLLQHFENSAEIFISQALGSVVTRALREVGENRMKYPTLSVKETMLKLFAIFLKAENPANTEYMRKKYYEKMHQFIQKCEVAEELHALSLEKSEKQDGRRAWT